MKTLCGDKKNQLYEHFMMTKFNCDKIKKKNSDRLINSSLNKTQKIKIVTSLEN